MSLEMTWKLNRACNLLNEENDDAILVFRCANCKCVAMVEGYKAVHSETATQLAGETQKLYCDECTKNWPFTER